MSYTAVLFDLDGTLVQSDEGILNCVEYALAECGYAVPPRESLRSFIGPPLPAEFARVTGCGPEEADRLTVKYRERYKPIGIFECRLYDGVFELLTALHAAGVKTAVATSKPTVFAARVLAHFGLESVVDALVGSELDGRHSGKEELIALACEKLGVSDRATVAMVGDRRFDMEGAKAAGVVACGVTYGYGTEQELREAGAEILAASADELRGILL